MTGPEHYREAERLLELAGVNDSVAEPPLVAVAQAHATLAVAAAMIETADMKAAELGGAAGPNTAEWDKAVGS